MKVKNLKLFKSLDPEDISSAHGDQERELRRKKLIN